MDSLRDLPRSQGFALILVMQGFLGGLQLLDAFSVEFYPMIHRASVTKEFDLGFSLLVPLLLLLCLWGFWMVRRRELRLVVLPLLGLVLYPFVNLEAAISTASLLALAVGLYASRFYEYFTKWSLLMLFFFEGFALLHWVVFVPLGVESPFVYLSSLELDMYYVLSYLAPLLVLPLMFMWLLKPIVSWGWNIDFESKHVSLPEKRIGHINVYLVLIVLLSMIASVYPFLPNLNPEGVSVGVDYHIYVNNARIVEMDVGQAFSVMSGERPLIFLLILLFQRLFGLSVETAVTYVPVLLAPFLVVSVFFLAKEVSRNDSVAIWSAFFTCTGIQMTVGLFAFFLANLLALSLTNFSLGLLFRGMRQRSHVFVIGASILGALLLFTHPWTFDQLFVSAIVFTGVIGYTGWKRRDYGVYSMMIYVFSLGFTEFLKMFLFQGMGGVQAASTIDRFFVDFSEFWFSSIFSFRYLFGGLISNVFLFLLAITGVYLIRKNILSEYFFIVYVALSSIIFLIGDDTIKTRLLYNVPIAFFSGLGLVWIINLNFTYPYRRYVYSTIVMISIVYLFRGLANLI